MSDKFSLIDELLRDIEPNQGGIQKPRMAKTASQDDAVLDLPKMAAGGREARPIKDTLNNDNALADAFKSLKEVEGHTHLDELTTNEVVGRMKYLLSLGHKPSRVAAQVDKLAELKLFDRKMTSEFLSDQAGGLGMAYIEPNFYMNSCDQSFAEIQKKGHLNALSVKKIAACEGCSKYKSGSCGLYCRPVVASASEMKKVAEAAVKQKGIKIATTLKAALVQMHEGTYQEGNKKAFHRVEEKTVTRSAGDKVAKVRKEASAEEIGKMIEAGLPFDQVYKNASSQYGKISALTAVKRYLAGLKQSKTKVVLAALDCSYLKGKLAASNAILGEAKSASCSYRSGTSCGLTGGTLLSYPGMNKAAEAKKILHEDAVKDGHNMLFEFELHDAPEDSPLDIGEDETPEEMNIELSQTSKIDLD